MEAVNQFIAEYHLYIILVLTVLSVVLGFFQFKSLKLQSTITNAAADLKVKLEDKHLSDAEIKDFLVKLIKGDFAQGPSDEQG